VAQASFGVGWPTVLALAYGLMQPAWNAEFCQKWGFDEGSQQLAEGFSPEVMQEVITGLNAGTMSTEQMLAAFLGSSSTDMGLPSAGSTATFTNPSAHVAQEFVDGTEQVVQQFIFQWGLDEVSSRLLRAQSPDYIREVTQSFNPPADTRNVSARFCTFMRGGSGFRQPPGMPGKGGIFQAPLQQSLMQSFQQPLGFNAVAVADPSAIQSFIEKWGLDDNCRHILQTLEPKVLQGVLVEFNPPGDTQNINARFMTFVRSRDKGGPGLSNLAPLMAPQMTTGTGRQAHDAMKAFVAKWGLDAQSEGYLRQLQPNQIMQVIMDFSPPPGTLNVSGRLTAFIKSVIKTSPVLSTSADPAEAFAQTWGLDDDAYQALCALPPRAKESVIREFKPPPGTLNVSGKLKAFIRHRGANEEVDNVGQNVGQGELLLGGGDGGRKRAWPTFSTGIVQAFVEKWRLDETAEHTLMSLPEDVLADVIQEFNPPPGTYNPSGRLHAFVRTRVDRDKPSDPMQTLQASLGFGGAVGGVQDESVNLDVRAFVDRWGLDGKSQMLLTGLPQDLLAIVMTSFEPDATTRNRNAKLASWIRFLQTSQGQGGEAKRPRY